MGSTDGCGDPATARCLANSLKTSPKAGKLWRSLLKSAFGMINTLMAVLARIVAFRVRSESNAISPQISCLSQLHSWMSTGPFRESRNFAVHLDPRNRVVAKNLMPRCCDCRMVKRPDI